jgi:hypothetical protein
MYKLIPEFSFITPVGMSEITKW